MSQDKNNPCEGACIESRGWTFQERLVSRCLIFLQNEVIWQCKHSCECESGIQSADFHADCNILPAILGSLPATKIFAKHHYRDPLTFWEYSSRQYASQQFSVANDHLPAIRDLATLVHDATNIGYLAGMWNFNLKEQLLWRTDP